MKRLLSGMPALAGTLEDDSRFLGKWVCATAAALLDKMEENVRCRGYADGVLTLEARSLAWKNQMISGAPELMRRINALARQSVVQRVEAVVAYEAFRAIENENTDRSGEAKQLSPEFRRTADQIQNKSLRAAFIKLGRKWDNLAGPGE